MTLSGVAVLIKPPTRSVVVYSKTYALATIHRTENTDDPHRLQAIFEALKKKSTEGLRVVMPLHSRTRKLFDASHLLNTRIKIIGPVSYLDMLQLEQGAKLILTDSGGFPVRLKTYLLVCAKLFVTHYQ